MRHTLPIAPQFYVTAPQPCPYLEGRMERKLKGTRENVVAEDVRRREHMGNVCFHCSEPESDAQLKYKSPKRHRPCTQLRDYHDVYVIWDTSSDDSDES